jgi:hypothetical protein
MSIHTYIHTHTHTHTHILPFKFQQDTHTHTLTHKYSDCVNVLKFGIYFITLVYIYFKACLQHTHTHA